MLYSAWSNHLMAMLPFGRLNPSACSFLDSASWPTSASSALGASTAAPVEGAPPSDSLEFAIQFVAATIVSVPGIGIVDSLLEG